MDHERPVEVASDPGRGRPWADVDDDSHQHRLVVVTRVMVAGTDTGGRSIVTVVPVIALSPRGKRGRRNGRST
jgi:hypothetical protein